MQQCTKLNITNRSKAYPERYRENVGKMSDRQIEKRFIFVFGFEGILSV